MTNEKNKDSSRSPGEAPMKKPYHPPTFRFQQVFEVTALSCGKISATQGTCNHNRKVS